MKKIQDFGILRLQRIRFYNVLIDNWLFYYHTLGFLKIFRNLQFTKLLPMFVHSCLFWGQINLNISNYALSLFKTFSFNGCFNIRVIRVQFILEPPISKKFLANAPFLTNFIFIWNAMRTKYGSFEWGITYLSQVHDKKINLFSEFLNKNNQVGSVETVEDLLEYCKNRTSQNTKVFSFELTIVYAEDSNSKFEIGDLGDDVLKDFISSVCFSYKKCYNKEIPLFSKIILDFFKPEIKETYVYSLLKSDDVMLIMYQYKYTVTEFHFSKAALLIVIQNCLLSLEELNILKDSSPCLIFVAKRQRKQTYLTPWTECLTPVGQPEMTYYETKLNETDLENKLVLSTEFDVEEFFSWSVKSSWLVEHIAKIGEKFEPLFLKSVYDYMEFLWSQVPTDRLIDFCPNMKIFIQQFSCILLRNFFVFQKQLFFELCDFLQRGAQISVQLQKLVVSHYDRVEIIIDFGWDFFFCNTLPVRPAHEVSLLLDSSLISMPKDETLQFIGKINVCDERIISFDEKYLLPIRWKYGDYYPTPELWDTCSVIEKFRLEEKNRPLGGISEADDAKFKHICQIRENNIRPDLWCSVFKIKNIWSFRQENKIRISVLRRKWLIKDEPDAEFRKMLKKQDRFKKKLRSEAEFVEFLFVKKRLLTPKKKHFNFLINIYIEKDFG